MEDDLPDLVPGRLGLSMVDVMFIATMTRKTGCSWGIHENAAAIRGELVTGGNDIWRRFSHFFALVSGAGPMEQGPMVWEVPMGKWEVHQETTCPMSNLVKPLTEQVARTDTDMHI